VLRRRYPNAHLVIAPARVQGEGAAGEIARALRLIGRVAGVDVVIVGRGGGSIEDLWAFNEEVVARAIAACPVPVISAVGHETDVTIADFVADLRAPTPSAAALATSPDKRAWQESLALLMTRFGGAMGRYLRAQRLGLGAVVQRLQVSHPGARLQQHAQRLDDLEQRLRLALRANIAHGQHRLGSLGTRLWRENPRHRLEALCARAAALRERLVGVFAGHLNTLEQRLALASRTLDAVSPLATLGRGFAVVTRADDGTLLRDAAQAPAGTEIEARLSKGRLRAVVKAQAEDRDD
jgi:exodeoxyribonuclease VII large subunit